MPAGHGFGLNDDQDLFSFGQDLRQENPEAPVGRSDPRSMSLLGERGELLTEGDFNNRPLASASKEGRDTAKEDRCEFEQVPPSEANSARVRRSMRDWISGRMPTAIGR